MELAINGNKRRVQRYQTTNDIIRLLLYAEADSRKYYSELRKKFKCDSPMETAKKIYDFSKNHLSYYKEPPSKQDVRSVARVLHDRYVDCKGFSTFILCCLRACDIPARYRFASYNFWDKTPKHVYVIATIDGEDVPMDGTIRQFGHEAAYKSYQDRKIKNSDMALNYLSGAGINSKASRKAKKAKRKTKQAARKAEPKMTTKQKIARVGAAPARAAFLAIIKLNLFKMADKLAKAGRLNPKKLQEFWAKFGGKYTDLKAAINSKVPSGAQINSVSAAAAIAAATPILIVVKQLIQDLGLFDRKEEADELQLGIDDGLEDLANDPTITKSFEVVPTDVKVAKFSAKGALKKTSQTNADADNADDADDDQMSNMLLYGGLALTAILVLPKLLK